MPTTAPPPLTRSTYHCPLTGQDLIRVERGHESALIYPRDLTRLVAEVEDEDNVTGTVPYFGVLLDESDVAAIRAQAREMGWPA